MVPEEYWQGWDEVSRAARATPKGTSAETDDELGDAELREAPINPNQTGKQGDGKGGGAMMPPMMMGGRGGAGSAAASGAPSAPMPTPGAGAAQGMAASAAGRPAAPLVPGGSSVGGSGVGGGAGLAGGGGVGASPGSAGGLGVGGPAGASGVAGGVSAAGAGPGDVNHDGIPDAYVQGGIDVDGDGIADLPRAGTPQWSSSPGGESGTGGFGPSGNGGVGGLHRGDADGGYRGGAPWISGNNQTVAGTGGAQLPSDHVQGSRWGGQRHSEGSVDSSGSEPGPHAGVTTPTREPLGAHATGIKATHSPAGDSSTGSQPLGGSSTGSGGGGLSTGSSAPGGGASGNDLSFSVDQAAMRQAMYSLADLSLYLGSIEPPPGGKLAFCQSAEPNQRETSEKSLEAKRQAATDLDDLVSRLGATAEGYAANEEWATSRAQGVGTDGGVGGGRTS